MTESFVEQHGQPPYGDPRLAAIAEFGAYLRDMTQPMLIASSAREAVSDLLAATTEITPGPMLAHSAASLVNGASETPIDIGSDRLFISRRELVEDVAITTVVGCTTQLPLRHRVDMLNVTVDVSRADAARLGAPMDETWYRRTRLGGKFERAIGAIANQPGSTHKLVRENLSFGIAALQQADIVDDDKASWLRASARLR